MKKICLKILVLIFSSCTTNYLFSSDPGRIPAPFAIPMVNKHPDYDRARLPLCSGYEQASDEIILSTVSDKLTEYMQCPYISQYEGTEQYELSRKHYLAQHKIDELRTQAYTNSRRLNKFNEDNKNPLSVLMLHQCILIKRLHELQQYKETVHANFIQKQHKL